MNQQWRQATRVLMAVGLMWLAGQAYAQDTETQFPARPKLGVALSGGVAGFLNIGYPF